MHNMWHAGLEYARMVFVPHWFLKQESRGRVRTTWIVAAIHPEGRINCQLHGIDERSRIRNLCNSRLCSCYS